MSDLTLADRRRAIATAATLPLRRSFAPAQKIRRWGGLAAYYGLLLLMTLAGLAYGFYFSEVFFASHKAAWIEAALNLLKLFWLIPLPYALLNFYSFARYPILRRELPGPITHALGATLYFRFVTRGHNPRLIAETVERARLILSAALTHDQWVIEVIADAAVTLRSSNRNVRLILVPRDYRPDSGSLYKARSLQYALTASTAAPKDWIVHLDEETRFDADTVRAIHAFVAAEQRRMAESRQARPRIGQGVILYGKGRVIHWFNTLADSIRVGDDYGRFRLQFENGKAYFGMHGSFIVINQAVEASIGFEHGWAGSITEDAYFALAAQAAGVEFRFIHAFMYEQSPFSIRDFVRQRRRWFGGLWLCALSPAIPLKERLVLGTFMVLWSVSWLCNVMIYVNLIYPTGTPLWLAMSGGLSFAYYVSLYVMGYLRTFDWRASPRQYFAGLLAQIVLVPVFTVTEAAGVIYGLLFPPKEFYIVQKEM
jgi:egghead protein (zeste-white 4 protein)